MADNRRAVVAWSAAVAAVAATLAGVVASRSTTGLAGNGWFVALLGITLVASAILVVAGLPDLVGWLRERRRQATRVGESESPLVTDRWRHTTDGFQVPAMLQLPQKAFTHRSYMRSAEDALPAIRIGAFVACDPLDPRTPSTSDLRARYMGFLSDPAFAGLIGEVTPGAEAIAWSPLAGNGRMTLEAVLNRADDEPPMASAMLLLPVTGASGYGRQRRGAELVLHIEPRAVDGISAGLADLAGWHNRLTQALAVPGALAEFLRRDAGVAVHGDPQAQFGVWLSTPRAITDLVDIGALKPLPGSWASAEFSGWAVADQDGANPLVTACDLLRQLCDHTLHLDGYEPILASLGTASSALRAGEDAEASPKAATRRRAAKNRTDASRLGGPFRKRLPGMTARPARAIAAATAIVLAVGAGATYVIWHADSSHTRISAAATPSGTITSPRGGATDVKQNKILHASGTAHNLQQDHRLWLFLYVPTAGGGTGLYYPSDSGPQLPADGRWSGAIYIGGTGHPGQRLTLWLAELGPKGIKNLGINTPGPSPGFARLHYASDVTPLFSVTFTTD